ncbi:hypothetical protein AQI88_23385 [Streptomyces cellostaticus]|uniref:Uncharacterized protein n=1 Tax=Streptomyces cellostaticus TaxID=67285 RepID=A0A101NJ19_9ACTN|nr:hypothetical protein [Streptomyces cellostaticus]KUM94105.1 hypothetical protein AQI88_23385 [Streptomyces cellostaticus]GHI05283.1 hypothetical protein Scel_36040 [Streptomyces cellostaticus]
MKFEDLYQANFKQLDAAVDDWGLLVHNLTELQKQAKDGLHNKAVKADWHGVNAGVSKEFIGKTAGEFEDATKEATSVHNILLDTRNELKQHKQQLHQAIENGRKKNLTVMPSGDGGFIVTMTVHPDRAAHGAKVPDHSVADEEALRNEVQKILDNAAKSDSTASGVLMALVDESEYGFSGAVYKDRDQAEKAVQEADELAKLARKDPSKLTPADFDKINAGLKQYHNDPLFSEEFAEQLGAQGTEKFWLGLTDDREGAHLGYERGYKYAELQKNLSLTLATASQSDSVGMTAWKQQVIATGNKAVGTHGDVLGFQVMSNLMRNGDFDDTFMNDYGRTLMKTERFYTHDGKNVAWQANICPQLNYEGTDGGWDPLNGYLKGLANNPTAATNFFNDDFIPQDGDHKKAVSNFDYLFKQRQWPMDIHDTHDVHSIAGQDYLAQALEAAATGHPAGEMPTIDTPAHTSAQTKLFEEIVSATADKQELLTDRGYMSDSLGQIASEYLPDINRANSDLPHTDLLYPIDGSAAHLDSPSVNKFLFAVGQNPEGYAAVEVGQKAYMSNLLQYHLNPDLPADHRFTNDHNLLVQTVAERSGEVSGILSQGRMEAIGHAAKGQDDSFDHAVAQYQNLISGGVGTVVGVGTSFIGSPVAGGIVGGAAGTGTGAVMQWLFQDVQGSAADDAQDDEGKVWNHGLNRNSAYAQRAAEQAVNRYHLSPDLVSYAQISAHQGYYNAQAIMHGQAPGSTADVP